MGNKNLIDKIKEFENITLSDDWKSSNKEILMSQIKAQVSDNSKVSKPIVFKRLVSGISSLRSTQLFAKHVGVVAMILILVLGTGALGVKAAEQTIPGDILYSVKLATEKVQVNLTTSPDKKAQLHLEFAGKRLQEIDTIKERSFNEDQKIESISTVVQGFQKELESVKGSLNIIEEKVKEPKKVVKVTKEIDKKVGEYKDILDKKVKKDIKKDLKNNKSEEKSENKEKDDEKKKQAENEINKAIKITKEVSDEAVIVLVQQKDKEGVEDDLKEEIKKAVLEKIDKAANDAKEVKESLDNLVENKDKENAEKDTLDGDDVLEGSSVKESPNDAKEVEKESSSIETEESDTNDSETEDSEIDNVDEKESSAAANNLNTEEEDKALDNIIEGPDKVSDLLEQASVLAESGDLDKAMEKFKESSLIVDNIKETVEAITDNDNEDSTEGEEVLEQVSNDNDQQKQGEEQDTEGVLPGTVEGSIDVNEDSSNETDSVNIQEETLDSEQSIQTDSKQEVN